MSYHKKHIKLFYQIDSLAFYKLPIYEMYQNSFILDVFFNNTDIRKNYKLAYCRYVKNPIFSHYDRDIRALEKILKRKY
jgi:hypothetical protein